MPESQNILKYADTFLHKQSWKRGKFIIVFSDMNCEIIIIFVGRGHKKEEQSQVCKHTECLPWRKRAKKKKNDDRTLKFHACIYFKVSFTSRTNLKMFGGSTGKCHLTWPDEANKLWSKPSFMSERDPKQKKETNPTSGRLKTAQTQRTH